MSIIDMIRDRERTARKMLIDRADVTLDEVLAASRTLNKLGKVNLDDLRVPPGFNLLPSGEVGSVNNETPEWQQWAAVSDLVDECRRLSYQLGRAYFDLRDACETET
jgi:hypothetical protein